MVVIDDTRKAEGLGHVFKNIGKVPATASK